jgi:hypothetical protein
MILTTEFERNNEIWKKRIRKWKSICGTNNVNSLPDLFWQSGQLPRGTSADDQHVSLCDMKTQMEIKSSEI